MKNSLVFTRISGVLGRFIPIFFLLAIFGCTPVPEKPMPIPDNPIEVVLPLGKDNWQTEVLDHKGVVVVDFYADWCGPCKLYAPVVERVAKKYGNAIKVGKVNVDNNAKLSNEYGIKGIPHTVIFRDGKIVKEWSGVSTAIKLENEIEAALLGHIID